MIPQKEIIDLFDQFINEQGLWSTFKEWIEDKGYRIAELGLPEDSED